MSTAKKFKTIAAGETPPLLYPGYKTEPRFWKSAANW